MGSFSDSSTGQFYITGLNSSTNYTAFLKKKIGYSGNVSPVGGVIFNRLDFTTNPNNSCSLVFGLDFCSGVAYSVPTSSRFSTNKTAIAGIYDNIANSLFSNFSNALQIIPCDTELDARYSPLRTCVDCSDAYQNWLCGVAIPRCSVNDSDYFIVRNKKNNRNSYINNDIEPINDYNEVLPCIDICHAIVRDCPSALGFACLTREDALLFYSYNYYRKYSTVPSCNFIGNFSDLVVVDSR